MSQSVEIPAKNDSLKPLYARAIVNSLGSGTVAPFLGVYARRGLGASPSEMGWFQSVTSLAPNMMQIPWGKLSDRLGRRVPFIVSGGLITAALWMPMIFVKSASQLIMLIAVQSILGSMCIPAWTALIGERVHSSKRGMIGAAINRWATTGSLVATLIAGYWMITAQVASEEMFFIPLLAALLLGVASSLVMLFVREKPRPRNASAGSLLSLKDITRDLRSSPDFVRFTVVNMIFGFFMAISWPLFSITVADSTLLNASMFEVALISVIQGAATIILQPRCGRLVDRVGRKHLIILYRLGLVTVPILYGLSTVVYHLYLGSVFFGILFAFGDVAMFAYLLDVTQEELRGTLTAFFNLVVGSVYFIGSLVGGYLANYFVGVFGLVLGLQLVYALSAIGRAAGALTFVTLNEPHKYPTTIRKELRKFAQKLSLTSG